MRILEKYIRVKADDLDDLMHVNNIRYLEWVQDIAKDHWFQNAPEDIQKAVYWVVLSHRIDYKSAAVLDDVIKLKTYVKSSEGVRSVRIVEMHNTVNDKPIVLAETVWCLINKSTGRPMKIDDSIRNLFE